MQVVTFCFPRQARGFFWKGCKPATKERIQTIRGTKTTARRLWMVWMTAILASQFPLTFIRLISTSPKNRSLEYLIIITFPINKIAIQLQVTIEKQHRTSAGSSGIQLTEVLQWPQCTYRGRLFLQR